MENEINSMVGEKITEYRKIKGIDKATLSTLTGLPELRIAQIETGKVRATVEELYSLKTALDIDLAALYSGFSGC